MRARVFLLLVLFLASTAAMLRAGPPRYGEKVAFARGEALSFPDFTLTPLGSRRVTPPQFPRGWDVHEFRLEAAGKTQVITWSAGTGDIGPTRFQAVGRAWDLSLRRHDRLGALKQNQLVVDPAR